MDWIILPCDAMAGLRALDAGSVQCCVTSPPYWGLRDYGVDGQLGLERTPDEYVASMVAVFREVWRVLRDNGTLWLNIGDSFICTATGGLSQRPTRMSGGRSTQIEGTRRPTKTADGLKTKDLVGIPWRVAFALQADGWYLRSDIIWSKPNPMPESVTDRPTKAHEYLFLLAKSQRYYYDADAIAELAKTAGKIGGFAGSKNQSVGIGRKLSGNQIPENDAIYVRKEFRNRRSVWTVNTQPYREAHFAVMPEKLVEPCIKAGSRPGDLVLDPFAGSGTVGVVAKRLRRSFIGFDLNPQYCVLADRRIASVEPGETQDETRERIALFKKMGVL